MAEPWTHHTAQVNGFRMHYVVAGAGYPLVFLHGWPQTWYEWRKIIPLLADHFTIIAPDLRGLGDSERPLTGYDKRTLASDVYQLVTTLGYTKVGLTGHDWGGTVAYYLAYDHPEVVERLLILESTPGIARVGEPIDLRGIRRLWHVFFQGGAPDLAEQLVRNQVELYLSRLSGCTQKLRMPVRAWGGERFMGDITPLWQRVAVDVQGGTVERCGHFMAEERPDFVVQQVEEVFAPLASE